MDQAQPDPPDAEAPPASIEKAPPRLEQARWISIGALPLDLQLEVLGTELPVRKDDPRPTALPGGMIAGGLAAVTFGIFHILFNETVGGFVSWWRITWLVLGSLFLARYLLSHHQLGFRARRGQQMILGSASLVVADSRAVRVIPAEALTVSMDEILLGKEVVGKLGGPWPRADWRDQLSKVIDEAKAKPETRDADRYRRAALRARPLPAFAVGWSLKVTQGIAFALAISSVLFLESGPLQRRAQRLEALRVESEAMGETEERTIQGREKGVAVAAALVAGRSRESLNRGALNGNEDDMRAFLKKYTDKDDSRARVQDKLASTCAAKLPPQPAFAQPKVRMLRAVFRAGCETPAHTVYYAPTGDADGAAYAFATELVRSAAKLAAEPTFHLSDAAYAPSGYPFVRLEMRKVGISWEIRVMPFDSSGSAVDGAAYTFRGPVVPGKVLL